jgi:hypothetical protein
MQDKEHNPYEILDEICKKIQDEEQKYDSFHKNKPLSLVPNLERELRRFYLDDEQLSKKAHEFLQQYARRNSQILTTKAKTVIDYLRANKNLRLYITELNIPNLKEGPGKHVTRIDMVSFYNMQVTMSLLEQVVRKPSGIQAFSRPHKKGNIENRYWVAHSLTLNQLQDKQEITDIKVRKRIHGTGYQFSKQQISELKRLGFSHLLDAFAH